MCHNPGPENFTRSRYFPQVSAVRIPRSNTLQSQINKKIAEACSKHSLRSNDKPKLQISCQSEKHK